MTSGQKITTNTIDETTAASGVTIDSVLLKDDGVNATNLEIINIKANDGTAAGSIADSTGVVTILSSILTTADINGGTADGVIIGGTTPAAATVTNLIANTDLIIAGTTTITAVLDEDNMASDSATALATQQSIKAYVDSQVGTVDTLAEILAIGNTTGGTDIVASTTDKVQFRDAAIYINSSVDGQLDIVADTEIQIAATTVDVNGALDVSGTALVTGVLTTTAATVSNGGGQFNGAINVGVDDTGYDVKFFGATAGAYMLWDESADDLILGGAAGLSVNSTALVTGVLTTTAATVFNGGFAAGGVGTFADGSNSAPSLTNTGDLNTGLYFPAADEVGLTVGGTQRLNVSATGISVTGTVVADGLSAAGLISTTASQSTDGQIRIRNSTTRASGNKYGIRFADSSFETNASIYAEQLSSGANGADLIFGTNNNTGGIGLTSATERMRISSSGGLITNPAAGGHAVFNEGGVDADFRVESDGNANMLFVDGGANTVSIGANSASNISPLNIQADEAGARAIRIVGRTDDYSELDFYENDNSTILARLQAHSSVLNIRSYGPPMVFQQTNADCFRITTTEAVFNESGADRDFRVESDTNANMLTVDAGNNTLGIGKFGDGGGATSKGAYFNDSAGNFFHQVNTHTSTTSTHCLLYLNRQSSDGDLVEFRQADSAEGTISVSGSTVSYNGFSGRHESSGIPANTPVGTVVSTINELDVYPDNTTNIEGNIVPHKKAGQTRADHAKVEVSTSAGDPCVYGVVSEFNGDGKLIVTSVGVGSIRVTGACSKGDLLESNGDGTAKVQSDDIIRSKTIGKVTIGNSDTGVKLVACVMYCG
jgi:hypothetical protein